MNFSWTQPCCFDCYAKRYPGRQPVRLKVAEKETCVDCGEETEDGIYIRVDPEHAAHPTLPKD